MGSASIDAPIIEFSHRLSAHIYQRVQSYHRDKRAIRRNNYMEISLVNLKPLDWIEDINNSKRLTLYKRFPPSSVQGIQISLPPISTLSCS
ncbi:hypothetical protein ACLOJK_034814 [Asimina triloba]